MLPLAGVAPIPGDLHIVQQEYRHDLAVFSVFSNWESAAYRAGQPVSISWREERNSASFYGYIHHVEPKVSTTATYARVWCRGASTIMEDGLQQVFHYRTVPTIVGEIARSLNFDVEAVPHGRVFDTITAPGGRLWDVLVSSAKDIGYSLYCLGTRLECHPRTYMLERDLASAPVLTLGKQENLFEFTPEDGPAPPGQDRVLRVVSGYDYTTGARFNVTGGVASGRMGRESARTTGTHYSDTDARSPLEARWILDAIAENNRFNIHATATALGSALVHPTSPVLLNGVTDRYNGLWFVRKVTHQLGNTDYFMQLELGRDAVGNNTSIPDTRARRVLATRANPSGRPKAVYAPAVLVNGKWRSQWSAASRTFVEPSKRVSR